MTTFIKAEDLPVIEGLAESSLSETLQKRVRLLLLYEAGMTTTEIAEKVDLSPGRVLYWRRMYLRNGIGVFGDAAEALADDEKAPKKMKKAKKKSSASPDALAARIARANKKRKKLKKRLKGLARKKAAPVRSRLRRLKRRVRRAKKALKKRQS